MTALASECGMASARWTQDRSVAATETRSVQPSALLSAQGYAIASAWPLECAWPLELRSTPAVAMGSRSVLALG